MQFTLSRIMAFVFLFAIFTNIIVKLLDSCFLSSLFNGLYPIRWFFSRNPSTINLPIEATQELGWYLGELIGLLATTIFYGVMLIVIIGTTHHVIFGKPPINEESTNVPD